MASRPLSREGGAGRRYARALSPDDGAALASIDAAYAEEHGLEPALTPGSLSFYARSGHAFVACLDDAPQGFALAQAVWDGARPVLQASRLAAAGDAPAEVAALLLEALTRSAYDAAVYDLKLLVPETDERTRTALHAQGFRLERLLAYGRTLGSRGRKASEDERSE